MTSQDDTNLPDELGDEAAASPEAQEILAWIKHCLAEERYADVALGLLPRIFCLAKSEERGGLLRFAVDSLVEGAEFMHALSLVATYPTTREGADEAEDVGLAFLTIAQQSDEPAHLVLARDFVRQHEKALEEMDAIELFLELAELTRDMDDLVRVQRQLDDLSDEANLFFRLRIVAITQDEKELSRLCTEIPRHDDPEESHELQGIVEEIIAKLPKAKADRLVPLLASEAAQRRTRAALTNYSLN